MKKLNMPDECDRALVYNKANVLSSFSKISMRGNAELIMFYCNLFMSDSVYYIKNYDAVIIANFVEDTIEVLDIFCAEEVSIDEILNFLVNENIKRVKLYFTPKETDFYIKTPLEGEDTLFILGKDTIKNLIYSILI